MIHDDFPFSSADSHDDLPIPNDDVPLRKANNSRVTPPQLHRETVQASPWDRPKASTRLRSMAMRSRYDATRRRLEHVWCLLVAKMLDVLTLSHWCWFQVADLAAEGHGNFADQLLKGLATSISLEIAKVNPVQFRGLLPKNIKSTVTIAIIHPPDHVSVFFPHKKGHFVGITRNPSRSPKKSHAKILDFLHDL